MLKIFNVVLEQPENRSIIYLKSNKSADALKEQDGCKEYHNLGLDLDKQSFSSYYEYGSFRHLISDHIIIIDLFVVILKQGMWILVL